MEIAVISGKGGTGKTSITASFATLGGDVVLADCDVDAANMYLLFNPVHDEESMFVSGHKAVIDYDLCTFCGLCMNYCRFDAISEDSGRIIISEISCDGCFLCSRICPEKAITMVPDDKSMMYSGSFRNGRMVYGRLAPGEENSGKLVNAVREKAKQTAAQYGLDTIILDGPPGIGCPVISTISGVDRVVIVTEPSKSALSDMERAIEVVQKFSIPAFVIINKFDLNESMSKQIEEWCAGKNVIVAGKLPFDRQITEAMIESKSINEYNPESETSKKIKGNMEQDRKLDDKQKLFEKIPMEGVKHIIVVASGKGGVGKSTVAGNLAAALAREGLNTALVDADIFGPSIPKMFGIENEKPGVATFGDKEVLFPITKYGVKIMSIGFFIDPSQSLIWRGPMAAKALTQLFGDTDWGEIDYMIVDFPPGTSDIQLTTVQKLKLSGALIVTTPQEISLNDARKAASMFTTPDLEVPILGVIENMSWFSPAKHPDEIYYIFGKGGGLQLAKEYDTVLLGQIPLVMEVGEAAEKGLSIFSQNNMPVIKVFEELAASIISLSDQA